MSEPKMNYFLTRVLAFLQCLIGFLLLAFGIVERVIVELWSSQVVIPIWVGVWIFAGGCLGIAASSRSRPTPLQSLVGTFMAFSIVSSVLAAVIIICYSVILAVEIPATNPCRRIYYSYHPYSSEYCPSSRTKNIAISVMVLLFGVAEFPIAIWSAVLQCRACACCYSDSTAYAAQSGQVLYMTNLAGGPCGQHVVAQPASTGQVQAPMYLSAQGASPATSQPVVMVQGQPMVPLSQSTGQPVVQGQSFVAVNQPQGQPVVQQQPVMTHSQQPAQYMVQGQPMMAVNQATGQSAVQEQPLMAVSQQTGQLLVQGQRVVALSQPSGQPVVQGQSLLAINQQSGQPVVQGQPVGQGQPVITFNQPSGQPVVQGQSPLAVSQHSGQPMVQGQYVVAISQPSGQPVLVATQPTGQPVAQGQPMVVASQPSTQPSGQPVVQGQPMVVASQPSGQPVVQGQQVLLVNEPLGQSVAAVSQPSSQPALQEQPMLVNQSPGQPAAVTSEAVQLGPVDAPEVSQQPSGPMSDNETENV